MIPKFPYNKKEWTVAEEIPGMFGRSNYFRCTPVTPRRNTEACYFEKKPVWMPTGADFTLGMGSAIYSSKLGRGLHADCTDAFGIQWEFVESAGGSIVHPGEPLLLDVNDWKEKIRIPDIDEWDWETEAADKKIDTRFSCNISLVNGFWFERLISFMDFMGAAMALIDEDQADALHELFEATTELGCKVIDKFCELYPQMDGINVHDDWGSQMAPFFSEEVAREFFVPCMKKLTDRIHQNGRYASLHSCGHNASRIKCFIDGGFDEWQPQPMNDVKKLYEEFGDKMIIGVFPERKDIAEMTEADQRAYAREFADFYCKPGKPAVLGIEGMRRATPAFLEELYEYSRKKYLQQ